MRPARKGRMSKHARPHIVRSRGSIVVRGGEVQGGLDCRILYTRNTWELRRDAIPSSPKQINATMFVHGSYNVRAGLV
jgi:hypothetical protein